MTTTSDTYPLDRLERHITHWGRQLEATTRAVANGGLSPQRPVNLACAETTWRTSLAILQRTDAPLAARLRQAITVNKTMEELVHLWGRAVVELTLVQEEHVTGADVARATQKEVQCRRDWQMPLAMARITTPPEPTPTTTPMYSERMNVVVNSDAEERKAAVAGGIHQLRTKSVWTPHISASLSAIPAPMTSADMDTLLTTATTTGAYVSINATGTVQVQYISPRYTLTISHHAALPPTTAICYDLRRLANTSRPITITQRNTTHTYTLVDSEYRVPPAATHDMIDRGWITIHPHRPTAAVSFAGRLFLRTHGYRT